MSAWGEKRKIQTKFKQERGLCPKCGKQDVFAHVYQRYQHLLNVPLYPKGKSFRAQCKSCGTYFYGENLQEEIRSHLDEQRRRTFTPPYLFIGVFVYGLFLYSLIRFFI